uniref:Cortactin-binding protein-2 N-terminal domain-containing protein n=1 Tax=Stegastes partitus TaxID=144197 RepID=A0A3B4ZF86_9TELE
MSSPAQPENTEDAWKFTHTSESKQRNSLTLIDLCVAAVLEKQCNELMMAKFGKLVDLEALQMLSGNRRLEELKHEKLLKEAEYAKEVQQWDVEEARQNLMEVTRCNTEHLRKATSLLEEKKELELKLHARQKKMGRQRFQDYRRHVDREDVRRLQELVKTQSQQAEALRREISLLSCKGGHVLPPDQTRLPPLLIHPSMIYTPLNPHEGRGGLESISADSG